MEDIEIELIDAITEKPYCFFVKDKKFSIYPKTLGKIKLLQPVYDSLGADESNIALDPYLEALRLCKEKKEIVCRVIAYNTFQKKNQILNDYLVKNRADFFLNELDDEDLASLLVLLITDDKVQKFSDYLGITKDTAMKQKIAKLKKDNNNVSVGGSSLYGTLIDFALNRYGWTIDYILWGVSYINLSMLYADQIITVSLTPEERRKLHIYDKDEVINGDDPQNIEKIKSICWD